VLKPPAALLSGSVGLLNDATDTLLYGFSSSVVYFGIRLHRERAVSLVLVIVMLATGVAMPYEAGRRFSVPLAELYVSEEALKPVLRPIWSGVHCKKMDDPVRTHVPTAGRRLDNGA
jgi:divalent metal cation (Fe/Co/Zn/Cd) transporter